MPDIKETMNAKSAAESLAAQQGAAKSAAEQAQAAKDQLKTLADQNKIHMDTGEAAKNSESSLKDLVGLVRTMLGKVEAQANTMAQMSASQQAASMAKPGAADNGDKTQEVHFKTVGTLLKMIVKAKLKEAVANTRMGKVFGKMSKVLAKQGQKATKTIDAKSMKQEGKGDGKPQAPQLDNKMLASSLMQGVVTALNPIALVTAFLTKVLPLIIILGILLYGFITGFLGGDVYDVIAVMVGIIIAAVLAYVAWMLIKEAIVIGIKIACEILKVVIEAAADWFAVGIIVAMVAVIGIAFLAAAALIIILLAAALLLIAVAFAFVFKMIIAQIVKLIKFLSDIFFTFIDKVINAFLTIIDKVFTIFSSVGDKFFDIIDRIFDLIMAPANMIMNLFQSVGNAVSSIIDKIVGLFSNVAGKLLGKVLGIFSKKAAVNEEVAAKPIVVNSLNAALWNDQKLGERMESAWREGINTFITTVTAAVMTTLATAFEAMIATATTLLTTMLTSMVALFASYMQTLGVALTQLTMLFGAAFTGITTITMAFIGLLMTMPLLGMLFGLVGKNSFKDAIAPLLRVTEQIADLLHYLVANAIARSTGTVKTTAINSSSVDGSETYNTTNIDNTAYPSDGERTFRDADQIPAARDTRSGTDALVTQAFLAEQVKILVNALGDLELSTGSDEEGGWF